MIVGRTFLLLNVQRRHNNVSLTTLRTRKLMATSPTPPHTPKIKNKKIPLWYPVVGGLFITVAGSIKYVHDHVGGTEGLVRTISFYSLAIPKYIQFRYHQWVGSPDEVWDELHKTTAQQGLDKMYELEGFYIKAGQMVAANIGGAFPPNWIATMSVLQDQVPYQPFPVIKAIIDSEMDFEQTFATFEEVPIGSAAIGQVHRATLRRDGTPVVVKVRYPNVERLLRGDVRTIKMFAQIAQPVHVPGIEEMEKQFVTEFDYVQEAEQLATVRSNLQKAGLEGPKRLCRVPMPYMDLCTRRVLVMEELHGVKLADGLKQEVQNLAQKQGKTVPQVLAEIKEKEEAAKSIGTEYLGPTSDEYDIYISLLDSQRRISNLFRRGYNWTVGLLPTTQKKPIEDKSSLPINHAKMIDDLLYIHGHEVLVDGYFNGDPHPVCSQSWPQEGNILLLRDDDGSPGLGLIDYGQVKRLSKESRQLFAKLIIALDDDDKEKIIACMKEAGMKTQNMHPEVIYLYARVSYAEINDQILEGMHVQVFMEELQHRDPIIELPKDWLMVSRCSLLLRGLAQAMHQNRNVATSWRPIAEKVLREGL